MSEANEFLAVGVDAGGTTTRATAARGGTVVGTAEGPGANLTTSGVDDAADAIVTTIRRALDHAHPDAIVIGAAGTGRAALARTLETLIESAFGGAQVSVGDDAAIALRAVVPEGPGIALVAGTGSIAYAENGERHVRVGGLGYLVGDEGSAFAIGMAAVRLLGRVFDGRQRADAVTDLVARTLAAEDRDAYLCALYDAPIVPAKIAALAPGIIAVAGTGDRLATRIVQTAAGELADLVKSAAQQAQLVDASPAVVLSGGLFRENSLLSYLLELRVVNDLPGAGVLRAPVDGAAGGALRLAELLAPR